MVSRYMGDTVPWFLFWKKKKNTVVTGCLDLTAEPSTSVGMCV